MIEVTFHPAITVPRGPHHRQLAPRIVALRLGGLTHQAIAYRLNCSETHVQRTLGLLKAEGLIA